MLNRIAITLLCVASLSGCASFISGGTGTAPVGIDSGTRSLGQVFIDSSVERTANINLYKLDTRFKQSRININSFHSNVLLTGQVPDAYLAKLAEENMRAMSDVKTVHNYITVGEKIPYNTIMQDTATTANTRALLLKAPVISEGKVSVHTEDGVMYIMGRLNNAEIADLSNVLGTVGNVNRIVTLIDNVEQATANTTPSAYSGTTTTPLVNSAVASTVVTPIAIDLDSVDPTQVQ